MGCQGTQDGLSPQRRMLGPTAPKKKPGCGSTTLQELCGLQERRGSGEQGWSLKTAPLGWNQKALWASSGLRIDPVPHPAIWAACVLQVPAEILPPKKPPGAGSPLSWASSE